MDGEKGRGRKGGKQAGVKEGEAARRVGLSAEKWICHSWTREQPVPARRGPAGSSASPACPEPSTLLL